MPGLCVLVRMPPIDGFTDRDIYTVSRLNSELRAVVDGSFPLVWVSGEISGLSTPRSGHLYFGLKDPHAQIRCALFRNRRTLLRFQPKDGDQVVLRAKLAVYEPRGDLQLIVEHVEPAGEGDLRRAFDALKAKLDKEGLFDTARKTPLPAFPRRLGVITSPSGAAIRDILQVLRRRFPGLPVLIYPVPVQGPEAAAEITAALKLADRRRDCDLLILARGGGAPEDLAAFNDETLARTIAALRIPLISAVGHEIDFTIADFVADRRAPTPSAGAELATPEIEQLGVQLYRFESGLKRAASGLLAKLRTHLLSAQRRLQLQHPRVRLRQQQQRSDELELRLNRALRLNLERQNKASAVLRRRLQVQSPQRQVKRLRQRLIEDRRRLGVEIHTTVHKCHTRLEAGVRHLNAMSPLQVLERGYAVARRSGSSVVIHRAGQIKVGESIELLLGSGRLDCTVDRRHFRKSR